MNTPAAAIRAWLPALCCIALALPAAVRAQATDARQGEVRVLASTGVRTVLETVQADAGRAIGRPLAIEFGSSRALKDVILSDRPFEVAIVTPEVLDAAIAKGTVRAEGRVDLARTMVAIAQRGGTPGAIGRPDALKARLVGARSIRFNPIGSGRPAIDAMFAGLHIDAATLGERIRPLLTRDEAPTSLGPGEYELTIVLDSEVAQLAPGASNLGPIPSPFQVPVVMAAGLGAKGDRAAAEALIALLRSAPVSRILIENHMTPLAGR